LLILDTIFVKGSASHLPWQNREAWKVFSRSAFYAGNGDVMRIREPRQDRRRNGNIDTHEIVEFDNDVGISQMRRLVGIEQLKFVALAVAEYQRAIAARLTFYMFGADEEENAAAVANVQKMYPDLQIVGRSHGYLKGNALRDKVDEINALAPDYLWVALGIPYEQAFVEEFTPRLSNVGVIKTSGGLFNFLSGSRARAPRWMQKIGLEWTWRVWLEPRRLFWRYLTTNPRALYLLFNRSRPSSTDRTPRG
jgi:exopolysaccharide biosynthesis WecB/TagA/CpsF family protein